MISFRRTYLDERLSRFEFSGTVLDLGGEKKGRRGTFKPPQSVEKWIFANLDPKTEPDLLCDATRVPLADQSVGTVLCSEVLEHLENPDAALTEIDRLLSPGGQFILTLPFLFSVHGDPHDYQRWTAQKIRTELTRRGFEILKLEPMGGIIGVCCDLFEMHCHESVTRRGRLTVTEKILRGLIRRVLLEWLVAKDRAYPFQSTTTTGYWVVARKGTGPTR